MLIDTNTPLCQKEKSLSRAEFGEKDLEEELGLQQRTVVPWLRDGSK